MGYIFGTVNQGEITFNVGSEMSSTLRYFSKQPDLVLNNTYLHIIIWVTLSLPKLSYAQVYFTEAHSIWNDRFDQWEIIGSMNEEEVVVHFELVWPLQRNWEEWRIEGDLFQGTIRTKWPGDPRMWEMRVNDAIILITQLNRNDVNRWEIRYDSQRVILQTQWFNNPNQWYFPQRKKQWTLYMDRENDPRDWIIEDFLEETMDPSLRLAAIFIVIWQTIPK